MWGLLVHFHFYDDFSVLLTGGNAGLMGILREEYSEMSGGHKELRRSLVSIELYIFLLVVFRRDVAAIYLRFPSHRLVIGERDLDVEVLDEPPCGSLPLLCL